MSVKTNTPFLRESGFGVIYKNYLVVKLWSSICISLLTWKVVSAGEIWVMLSCTQIGEDGNVGVFLAR